MGEVIPFKRRAGAQPQLGDFVMPETAKEQYALAIKVFAQNYEMLIAATGDNFDYADYTTLFTDPRYPGELMMDAYMTNETGLRGLYRVNRDTWKLEQVSDEPLLEESRAVR